MNKIAVVLFILTAAIGIPHTALAQQNALDTFMENAYNRMGKCNRISHEAYKAKVAGDEYNVVKQKFDLVDACIATAKKDTSLEYQAALNLANLARKEHRYVAGVKFYHRQWLSMIGRSRTQGGIDHANEVLRRQEMRIYTGQ
jgi:hypothetical protein